MNRFHFRFALLFVALLIGGASWTRFVSAKKATGSLTAVANPDNNGITEDDVLNAALADLAAASSTPTGPTQPLTDTDLISRQLLSDFMDLSSGGNVSDDQVAALANTYIDNISSLDKSEAITAANITIVPDSQTVFQSYADGFTSIYAKYEGLLQTQLSSVDPIAVGGNPNLTASFADTLSTLYGREEKELQSLPTPNSLKEAHLKLLNNYSSSASAYHSLSKSQTDPASAFGGIVISKKNQTEETAILAEIEKILTDHGI